MKALILAAGSGLRLGAAAGGLPKGLAKVGGASLLERQVATLTARGIDQICLVTGYAFRRLEQQFGSRVAYRYNPFFAQSNNLVSVLLARDWMDDDLLILYADLIYDPGVLDPLLAASGEISLLVDRSAIAPGHALVRIAAGGIQAIGADLPAGEADARFVGMAKLTRKGLAAFLPALEEAAKEGWLDHYYTIVLQALAAAGHRLEPVEVGGRLWREIDSPDDLEAARRETWS